MDNQELLRLQGTVENIVYRNEENGYTVLEIIGGDDYITAVGSMPQVNAGDNVNLLGYFTNHRSYGRQFSVKSCEVERPSEAADILLADILGMPQVDGRRVQILHHDGGCALYAEARVQKRVGDRFGQTGIKREDRIIPDHLLFRRHASQRLHARAHDQ